MTEVDGTECLINYASGQMVRNSFWIPFQDVQDSELTVLENQVKFPLPPEDLNQIDEVGILELLFLENTFD